MSMFTWYALEYKAPLISIGISFLLPICLSHECYHHRSSHPVNCIDCRPPSWSLITGHLYTVCDIVWTVPHPHLSHDTRPHLCRFTAQRPWPVRKWFSTHHVQWEIKTRLQGCRFSHKCLYPTPRNRTMPHLGWMVLYQSREDIETWGAEVGGLKMSLWTGQSGWAFTMSKNAALRRRLVCVSLRHGWRHGVRRMNEVNASRAPLVPGSVTVFGRVFRLGM